MKKFHTVVRVTSRKQGQVTWLREEDEYYTSAQHYEDHYSELFVNSSATVINQFTTFE